MVISLVLVSCQTAVHRSFAVADNLGEVSAKAQVNYGHNFCWISSFSLSMMNLKFYVGLQIQTVCFDNLGLVLAAVLNIAIKNNQRFATEFPRLIP